MKKKKETKKEEDYWPYQIPILIIFMMVIGCLTVFVLPDIQKPEFKITKEECNDEKGFEVYCGNENFGMKIWSDIELNESEESLINLFLMVDEDLKDCKLVNRTSCEQVEVDELVVCCLDMETINSFENLSNHADIGSTIIKNDYFENYCFPKENLEYYEVPCGIMKKEDLTIEWLDLNAKCLECYDKKTNSMTLDGCSFEYDECFKYKFGEYYIELK